MEELVFKRMITNEHQVTLSVASRNVTDLMTCHLEVTQLGQVDFEQPSEQLLWRAERGRKKKKRRCWENWSVALGETLPIIPFHPPDHLMCSHPSRSPQGPSNSLSLSRFSNSTHLLEGVCHMGLISVIVLWAQPHDMCFSCFEFHPSFSLAAPHAPANLLLTRTCRFFFGPLFLILTLTGMVLPQPNKDRLAQSS